MECAVGQRMDGVSGQCGRVLLLRWARARLSRRENAAAASLRGAGTVVFASDGGLLGQCHGWSAVSLRQQGGRSGTDRHAQERRRSLAPAVGSKNGRARTTAGRRSPRPLVHTGIRSGRLQSGTFRRIVSEANRDPYLSQVSQRGLACRAVPCVSCRIGRRTEGDDEVVRARHTSLQRSVAARGSQTHRQRPSDGDVNDQLLRTDARVGRVDARWCQENFFRYMREQYGLDRLVEYGTELVPDITEVVHPQWRRLDSQIRSKTGQRQRLHAKFGAMALSEGLSEDEVQTYERRKGELQEQIQHLNVEIDQLKQQRKQTQHHIPLQSLPEEERFTRLRTERKHFLDTIKMIAYRAETSLVSILREHLARSDDARTLVRQIFETEADLLPDEQNKTLTVRIHHLTQAAHDLVLGKLCDALNETRTVFPGTDLTLIFQIGSS